MVKAAFLEPSTDPTPDVKVMPSPPATEIAEPALPEGVTHISAASGYRPEAERDEYSGAQAMHGNAALADTPVPLNATGEVYDMARYRREQEARMAVEQAFETMPPADR